ncbi:MAG: bifunctional oligoribonuclease/PAP phosphatase NrnA [bacterium]|nr:bifunctional oligoribonuclease/PAP phosphatase NrnA [bacterium]
MKHKDNLDKVVEKINQAKSILVLAHYNPDGDAFGSSLGLYLALKSLGKKVAIVNETAVIDKFQFMPSIKDIKTSAKDVDYEILISCDCGDRKRFGDKLGSEFSESTQIINIDHHASNTNFGILNWIEGEASSTSEMIYVLLEKLQVKFTKEIAVNLLTGIITDTGSFRYSSTSPDTLRAAARLLETGADLSLISRAMFETRSRESVLLFAKTISNIEFFSEGKISLLTVTQDSLKQSASSLDDTEGLVEEGRSIKGVVVSVLLKEDLDQWQVSMRSSSSNSDVSLLASKFGGGGHKAAAGFRWKKVRGDLREKLMPELLKIV